MKTAISIPELSKEVKQGKGIEFTAIWRNGSWEKPYTFPHDWENVIHLGNNNGVDYFVAWDNIHLDGMQQYKGHLNDGTY